MESLPDPNDIFESAAWCSPTSFEQQNLLLLDYQRKHQDKLYASSVAYTAYETLDAFAKKTFDDTPPAFQKCVVFRRFYPNMPNQPDNYSFGVVFGVTTFPKLSSAKQEWLKYVYVGEYVDGIIHPPSTTRNTSPDFSDNDRSFVFGLVNEIIGSKAQGFLPNIKDNLTALR